jgi:hypothetical protein
MDSSEFDALVRDLTSTRSRRSALMGAVGGALGLVGLAQSQAKGGGKGGGGKGKGKGKGKDKKKDKKRVTCLGITAICGGSSCGMDDVCCEQIDCDCRQGLYCNRVDLSDEMGSCGCLPGEEYVNGRCGTKPDCIPAGGRRGFFDRLCCSGSQHTEGPDDAPYDVCDAGDLVCLSDGDCTGGSCRGYACYAPELDCNIYYQERR